MIFSSSTSRTSEILEDARLSSDSVRVLLYVLTSGDENPDKTQVIKLTRSGYIRVLRELETVGYLLRTRQRVGHRGWVNERFWYEDPRDNLVGDSSALVMDSQYLESPKTKAYVDYDLDTYVDVSLLQNVSSVDHGSPLVEARPNTSLRSGGSDMDPENKVPGNTLSFLEDRGELGEFDESLLSVALACEISLETFEFLVDKGFWKRVGEIGQRNYT